jgi:DNA replication protein DnaC
MKMVDCLCYDFCPKAGSSTCTSRCIKNIELTYLLKNSGLPTKKQVIKPLIESKRDKKVIDTVRNIAENIVDYVDGGTNIILYSEKTGNGKTTMAINLMLTYFNEVWAGNGFRDRGYFIYVPTYLNRCKDNISKFDATLLELKKRVVTDDLLILDDICTTAMSEYDVSLLSTIINERLLAEKSMIVTTNCNKAQFSEMVGERITDRLWSTSVNLHLTSDSYRGVM